MLVGIECDNCFKERKDDPFTLQIEHLLDGTRIWYCDNGHLDHLPFTEFFQCLYRDGTRKQKIVHLPASIIKKWGRSPLSSIVYHDHSGYGIHIATRKHQRTKYQGRRFRTLEEFKEALKKGEL